MIFKFVSSTLIVFSLLLSTSFSKASALTQNVDKKGVALSGFDPVSYFASDSKSKGPQAGKPEISAKYEGVTYYFSSQANVDEFNKNPKKYAPAFGGWCAYAVADHKSKVEVDPKSFLIQDGRLLLFYNGFLADTRKKWQSTKNKTPEQFLKLADENWSEVEKKEP